MLERLCVSVFDEISESQRCIDHDATTLVIASELVSKTESISGKLHYLFDHAKDARELNRLIGILGVHASEKSKEIIPKLDGMLDNLNTLHYKLMQDKDDTISTWRKHIEKRVLDLERQSHDSKTAASRDGMNIALKPVDALRILIPLEEVSVALYKEANELFLAETIFSKCSDDQR